MRFIKVTERAAQHDSSIYLPPTLTFYALSTHADTDTHAQRDTHSVCLQHYMYIAICQYEKVACFALLMLPYSEISAVTSEEEMFKTFCYILV